MRKTFLILMLLFTGSLTFAQSFIEAEKIVDEGVADHDKGDFNAAIAKYDRALGLDKDNLLALSEKAYSLTALQKYEDAIGVCQLAIAAHPGDEKLRMVYVTYGNALDALHRTDESIAMYDEGIKAFPDFYLIHFNKGITLSGVEKTADALLCFEKAVMLNPRHASSHNAIARLSNNDQKRIPALLAFARFLTLEMQGTRAQGNLATLQAIMKANVEERGKGVTINLNADMLNDATGKGAPRENNFASTDMILSMASALDYEKEYKKKTEVENFIRKFQSVCSSLEEGKKDNFGFFWDYYVPYFVQMKEKDLIEPFGYVVYASSGDAYVKKWLEGHRAEIDQFLEWSKAFQWKMN